MPDNAKIIFLRPWFQNKSFEFLLKRAKIGIPAPYQVRGRLHVIPVKTGAESSASLVPGFRRDDVWTPAPVPDPIRDSPG